MWVFWFRGHPGLDQENSTARNTKCYRKWSNFISLLLKIHCFLLLHILQHTNENNVPHGMLNWSFIGLEEITLSISQEIQNNKLHNNDSKIQEIQTKLLSQSYNPILQQHLSRLIRQREKLMLYGRKYSGKMASKTWLTQGDRN